MTRTWVTRGAWVLAGWASLYGVGWVYGMSPRPLPIAAAVLAGGALLWLATDLGTAVDASRWHLPETVRHVERGTDPRVGILHRSLSDPDDSRGYARNVHPALVAVVDERLRTQHGIDRATDPARARALLGDELADFLRQPAPGAAARDPQHLSDLLSLIEGL